MVEIDWSAIEAVFERTIVNCEEGRRYVEVTSNSSFWQDEAMKLADIGVYPTKIAHSSELRNWTHDETGYRIWFQNMDVETEEIEKTVVEEQQTVTLG